MSTTALPEAGSSIVAARTRTLQVPVVVGTAQFGVSTTSALANNMPTRGMSNIRCQLLHYPVYDATGVSGSPWLARNYLMFRVVGSAAPFKPYNLSGYTLGGTSGFTPLTPNLLIPVGPPIEVVIPAAGFEVVWVEFDTTGGTANAQQGYDLVLVTLTASAA